MTQSVHQKVNFSWIDDVLERLAGAVLGLKPQPVPVPPPQKRAANWKVRQKRIVAARRSQY